MSITTAVGYFAASLVFATFCANRMASLRVLAIASNISFICYGSLLGLWPIVVLHCAMLPVNIVRLHEARAARPRSPASCRRPVATVSLRPGYPLVRPVARARTTATRTLRHAQRRFW